MEKHYYLTPEAIELELDNQQVLCMSTEDFTIVEEEYEGFQTRAMFNNLTESEKELEKYYQSIPFDYNNFELLYQSDVVKELEESDFGFFRKNSLSSWNISRNPRLDDHDYAIQEFLNKMFVYDYKIRKEVNYGTSTNKRDSRHISNEYFLNSDSGEILQILNGINFKQKNVKRIYSERNILPEKDSNIIQIDGNGNGASNIINKFINLNNCSYET